MKAGCVMSRWTVRSWIALGLLVVAFPLAMVAGEGLLTLLADNPDDPSLSAIAVAGGVGTLIFVSPPIASLLLGRRGLAEGDPRAKAPMIVAGVLLVVILAQAMLGVVGNFL